MSESYIEQLQQRLRESERREGKLREALESLVEIIDKAGLLNLSNGVQLGQTSWYVKASDRLEFARAALAHPQADDAERLTSTVWLRTTTANLEDGSQIDGSVHEGDYWWRFIRDGRETYLRLMPQTMEAMIAIYALLLRQEVAKEDSVAQPQAATTTDWVIASQDDELGCWFHGHKDEVPAGYSVLCVNVAQPQGEQQVKDPEDRPALRPSEIGMHWESGNG